MIILNTLVKLLPEYNDLSRSQKRNILTCCDGIISLISILIAFVLFYGISQTTEIFSIYLWVIGLYFISKSIILNVFGFYKPVVKYTDLEFISTIIKSMITSTFIGIILLLLFTENNISLSVIVIDSLISIIAIFGSRVTIRTVIKSNLLNGLDSNPLELIVIYGAGSMGYQLAQNLEQSPEYKLIAFVDDNLELEGRFIRDIPIYRPNFLPVLFTQTPFNTLIFAIPNLPSFRRREILKNLESLPVNFKSIPTLKELLSDEASVSQLRNIDVTDLLGRDEIVPDDSLLKINITDRAVLVTGAGGSIGSELSRQVLQLQPKCLVLFELNEFALYSIELELRERKVDVPIHAYLGSVTDKSHFESILNFHNIETIYHAAAYKHVPLLEKNPIIGVYNNVAGTLVTAQCAIATSVENYVLISTDKAVRPANVMGASKRVAELIIQSLAKQENINTTFAIVRFGNVLNSSGSVIPRFKKQIAEGKPITLTHKEITRYFISIPEAVSLVIQAGAIARGGEIFLLDMGEPVKIYDLAVKMIQLSGMVPGKDIPIEIVGLRPGEKLYEELLIDKNNSNPTQHPQIFYGKEPMIEWNKLQPNLDKLLNEAHSRNKNNLLKQLKQLVPEFKNIDQVKSEKKLLI